MAGNAKKFSVATLAAAGFMIADTTYAAEHEAPENKSLFDDVKEIVEKMTDSHVYTLAQHQSHASHSSHGSHASHRSYYQPPPVEDDTVRNDHGGIELAVGRNDRSTPATSVLPSSPAVTQKLKVLKGNTHKFTEVVTAAQLALLSRGYEIASLDGKFDAKTMSALFKFQSDHGFNPTGKLTPEVLTALNVNAN